jgi:hypothetical protein
MKNKGKKISFLLIVIMIIIFFGLLLLSPGNVSKTTPAEAPKMTEVDIEIVDDVKPVKTMPEKKTETVRDSSESENNKGALPPLHANYREFLGFAKYASAMEKAGGRFFIISPSMKHILRIDFYRNSLSPVSIKSISSHNFSPRTRAISDEPALAPMIRKAERIYGIRNPEVILLVPKRLENKIALMVSEELSRKGASLGEVSALYGHYMVRGGNLALNISRAESFKRRDPVRMNLNIYL